MEMAQNESIYAIELENKKIALERTDIRTIMEAVKEVANRCYDINTLSYKNLVGYTSDPLQEKHLKFKIDNKSVFVKILDDKQNESELSAIALLQYCDKHHIPKAYITRCIDASKIALAEDNLNAWTEGSNAGILLRMIKSKGLNTSYVRAYFSNRYSRYDNQEMLDNILPVLQDDFIIKTGCANEDIMVLRFYEKNPMIVDGKEVRIGVQVKNSETGFYPICMNYMITIDGIEYPCFGENKNYISVKHNFSKENKPDLAALSQELLSHKEDIKNLTMKSLKNAKITPELMNAFMDKVKKILTKDDFGDIVVSIPTNANKLTVGKTILNVASDYSFIKKEALEMLIGEFMFN